MNWDGLDLTDGTLFDEADWPQGDPLIRAERTSIRQRHKDSDPLVVRLLDEYEKSLSRIHHLIESEWADRMESGMRDDS